MEFSSLFKTIARSKTVYTFQRDLYVSLVKSSYNAVIQTYLLSYYRYKQAGMYWEWQQ
jgi:hypothetical protein